jgi:hypothetical protein
MNRGMSWVLGLFVACAVVVNFGGCGSDGGTPGDGGDGGFVDPDAMAVDSLAIDPASATLVVNASGPPKTQVFKALGTWMGGAPFEVQAVFTIDNSGPGTMSPSGTFTTNDLAGGTVTVKAEYDGKSATAQLIVKLEEDQTSGNVPTNPGSLFDPNTNTVITGDATHGPSLVYPVNETKFPQNLYRTMFNWRPGLGNNLWLLEYTSQNLTLKVYTDGVHATCDAAATGGKCWETVQKQWTMLALSNAGGSVALTVYGTDVNNPGTVYASKAYDFSFSKSPVPGALYYWSTTVAGVRRGLLSDLAPTNFLTPAEADGNCVACHTLSRNGKRLAADVGGENLWVVDVVKTVPPPRVFTSYNNQKIPSSWATFNPDATRIVSATKGVMRLLDGNTGAPIGGTNGAIAGTGLATMPDWAPDGNHLVFAVVNGKGADRNLANSSIAWMSVANDTFTNAQVILQSASTTDNYAYPMFNPTSDWIAVARGANKTDNDKTAQVYVAKAQPASTADQLVRADTLVNDTVVTTGISNTMPTWAPTSADGIQWVAFSSLRDYGTILTPGSALGSGMKQLWIAAIDTTKLGQGDPSFPAFRVPFVSLSENCHRPFWAEDAFNPPPPTDGGVPDAGCLPSGADCSKGTCCDGLQCLPAGNTYQCGVPVN